MSESYEVDTSALTQHARRLNGFADELRSVLETAGGTNLPDDAFGETGRAAAVTLAGLGQAGQDTLRAGVDGLDAEGTKVHDSAAAYEQQETDAKARLAEVEDDLSGSGGGPGQRPVDPEVPTS